MSEYECPVTRGPCLGLERFMIDRETDGRTANQSGMNGGGRHLADAPDTDVSSSTTTTTITITNGIFFVVFVDTIEMKTNIETEYEN